MSNKFHWIYKKSAWKLLNIESSQIYSCLYSSTNSTRAIGSASAAIAKDEEIQPTTHLLTPSPSTVIQTSQPSIFTSKNKDRIAQLHQRNEVKIDLLPVRKDFIRDEPLTTEDLQAIDIQVYHRKPETISDYVAYNTVKFMRIFADAFFQSRYVHRAIVLETVAGVPGMVAGMFCHLKSLRRMQNDNGWIERLLHEAENERMHLMIWMQVTKPTMMERMVVTLAQGVFWNAYAFFYLLFPRTAHRMVGYLEEEAIVSYNGFAHEILKGNIENCPAPKVAIDYYNLDKNAKLLDVVYAVRADEAAHRDANHHFADKIDTMDENPKI
uniref:Alternative oxidase n=1 Tax=Acrobeloides nanus TaxID=290746 RepID=A0A914CVT0_9BILA